MTADELDELEALANAATPGPWKLITSRVGPASPHHAPKVDHAVMSNGGPVVAFGIHSQRADPRFIAAAREAVPKLIARVRVLEDMLDQMEALLDEPPCDHCNNCDEGCWGPRRESMQDRGSRAQRGQIKVRDNE